MFPPFIILWLISPFSTEAQKSNLLDLECDNNKTEAPSIASLSDEPRAGRQKRFWLLLCLNFPDCCDFKGKDICGFPCPVCPKKYTPYGPSTTTTIKPKAPGAGGLAALLAQAGETSASGSPSSPGAALAALAQASGTPGMGGTPGGLANLAALAQASGMGGTPGGLASLAALAQASGTSGMGGTPGGLASLAALAQASGRPGGGGTPGGLAGLAALAQAQSGGGSSESSLPTSPGTSVQDLMRLQNAGKSGGSPLAIQGLGQSGAGKLPPLGKQILSSKKKGQITYSDHKRLPPTHVTFSQESNDPYGTIVSIPAKGATPKEVVQSAPSEISSASLPGGLAALIGQLPPGALASLSGGLPGDGAPSLAALAALAGQVGADTGSALPPGSPPSLAALAALAGQVGADTGSALPPGSPPSLAALAALAGQAGVGPGSTLPEGVEIGPLGIDIFADEEFDVSGFGDYEYTDYEDEGGNSIRRRYWQGNSPHAGQPFAKVQIISQSPPEIEYNVDEEYDYLNAPSIIQTDARTYHDQLTPEESKYLFNVPKPRREPPRISQSWWQRMTSSVSRQVKRLWS